MALHGRNLLWLVPAVLWPLCATACGGDGETGVPSDAGAAFDGRIVEGGTAADAGKSDASSVGPITGTGECAWQPGERPTAQLPPEHQNAYTIELEKWQIANDRTEPVKTRAGINQAITWAKSNGFDKVVVPPGTYLIGESTGDDYAAGIELEGDMTFELSAGAILEMVANSKWNYCVISVNGHSNITIRGGEVLGDRANHTYSGGAHDEGHGICVWTSVDRILIEDMQLHELTGDGVLVVGAAAKDSEPEKPSSNITIRDNDIHHNRRQGVSLVGSRNVVIENNHIHHMEGTAPQFGIDIEGAGRTDRDVLIYQNNFHNNAGGDFVTSTGRNVWVEENTMTQCQVDDQGTWDPSRPCELKAQSDGPIVLWKETDNVVINNTVRMSMGTANGRWGLIGYATDGKPTRDNPVGNYIAGNTFYDSGIHITQNARYFVSNNTVHDGLILGYQLACTRLEYNRINRTAGENYKLRNVAGLAQGNVLNRTEGAPPDKDIALEFPMADDAPYRNSSPVYW